MHFPCRHTGCQHVHVRMRMCMMRLTWPGGTRKTYFARVSSTFFLFSSVTCTHTTQVCQTSGFVVRDLGSRAQLACCMLSPFWMGMKSNQYAGKRGVCRGAMVVCNWLAHVAALGSLVHRSDV
jgi:hypothetical protein